MWQNYLKITIRTLRRQAGYTAINVFGLALGLTCCLLIFLFVQDELSFDRFHEQADRIYRVERGVPGQPDGGTSSFTDGPTGPSLADDYPEVEAAVRFSRHERLVSRGERQFFGERIAYVDSTFFSVFSFALRRGDPSSALAAPYSIVLTEQLAHRYFGDEDPMGQTLRVDNADDYTVTGVMDDAPPNSHYRFEALASFATLPPRQPHLNQRGSISLQTYVLLREGTSEVAFENRLPEYVARYYGDDSARQQAFYLRPMVDIHLRSNTYELEPQGDIDTIYLFSAIALFILLLACINYMNLATARAARRVREVGVRKVLGAQRRQLVIQFLGESVLLSSAALAIGVGLAQFALPSMASFLDRPLSLNMLGGTGLALLVGGTVAIGLLAGSYPALYLTRFRPASVLKGAMHAGRGAVRFRRALVVTQFVVSIALLMATAVVYQQLGFIQQRHLGFDKEHVVNVSLRDPALIEKAQLLQERLSEDARIAGTSISSTGVSEFSRSTYVAPEGVENLIEDGQVTGFLFTDADFVPTLGITMAAGLNFHRDRAPRPEADVLLNEAAAAAFGWTAEEAVGQRIWSRGWMQEGNVIGVVKDFNVRSLRSDVPPMLLVDEYLQDDAVLSVRLRPAGADGGVGAMLLRIEKEWGQIIPDWPFEYAFLDEQVDQLYRRDRQTGRLFGVFAVLAVSIACLGLFGLAAYAAERRTKEIGLRKVLGASVPQVVGLLTREFIGLVLAAFTVAAPVAYVLMSRWLDDFAYRIEISWGIFLFAGLVSLAIAFLTVSWQAIRMALADPATALRYE